MLTSADNPLDALLAPRPQLRIRWGLERIRTMLRALGDPHREWRSLHVGGTNGKGSVAAAVEAALRRSGCRTGLYTSPHLVSFAERVRIAGVPASRELLEACAAEVLPLARRHGATFFEAATAVGFLAFARAGVETAVIEVGLGGRLDATNVVRPEVTAITGVAMDHADYLGETLEAIAGEKAGILKRGVPAVAGPMRHGPAAVIRGIAAQVGAPIAWVREGSRPGPGGGAAVEVLEVGLEGTAFRYRSAAAPGGLVARTPLIGKHQATNAALALLTLERAGVAPQTATPGLAAIRWPGRFQVAPTSDGTWVFDVAHNVAGVQALATALDDVPIPEPRVALVGILGDKEWREMLLPILARVQRAIFTVAPSAPPERRWDPAEARAAVGGARVEVASEFGDALARARRLAGRGSVLVTGSCYTVGDALARLGICGETAGEREVVDGARAIR